jgi:hypothetical protein
MAILSTGNTFGATETVTSTKLNNIANAATFDDPVDETTLEKHTDGKLRIKDSGVTKAKIENVADMKVLGNTSGSATAPQEVSVLDEDNMSSDSATSLATQQSIKAYVDGASSPTDGFAPTSYSGGESVTLPNGLIIKMGSVTATANAATTVTFASAFPSGFVSGSAVFNEDTNTDRNSPKLVNAGASSMQIRNTHGADLSVYWVAYGY